MIKGYTAWIFSINPECTKTKGPFATIEEAEKAGLKYKDKVDRFFFPYFRVDIHAVCDWRTGDLVKRIIFE